MSHAKHQRLNVLFFGVARFRPGVQAQHEALKSSFNAHYDAASQPSNLSGCRHSRRLWRSIRRVHAVEADSIGAIRQFLKDSPYAQANLYEQIEIDALQLEVGHL